MTAPMTFVPSAGLFKSYVATRLRSRCGATADVFGNRLAGPDDGVDERFPDDEDGGGGVAHGSLLTAYRPWRVGGREQAQTRRAGDRLRARFGGDTPGRGP